MGPQLNVDGARPAIARVAALPQSWTTEGERLVLLALACDSYDGKTCAPGYDAVAAWTGLHRPSVIKIMARLAQPNERRPSLLARDQTTRGGRRTVWSLLLPIPLPVPVSGADRSDNPQPVREDDRLNRYAPQTGKGKLTGAQPVPNQYAPLTGNRYAPQTAPVTPVDPSVVDVPTYGGDAHVRVGAREADLAELTVAVPPRTFGRGLAGELQLADPDTVDYPPNEMGPCVRCYQPTHRYGPTPGGNPLCRACRNANPASNPASPVARSA